MAQNKMHYTVIDKAKAVLAAGGNQVGIVIGGTENNSLTHKFASTPGGTEDKEIKLTLVDLMYEKAMYKSGHMILTFTTTDSIDLIRKGLDDLATKDVVFSANLHSNFVAEGYYIHSTRITQQRDAEKGIVTRVIMHCYSPDHKLALKPACNAWTGKKFAEEVVAGYLKGANFIQHDEKDANKDFAANRYFRTSAANLSFLANTKNASVTEARQPYLVQYNESFYDFLCRTANRCGEFVYHDRGHFCIGLPDGTLTKIRGGAPSDKDSETNAIPDIIDTGDFINADDAKDSTSIYSNNYQNGSVTEVGKDDEAQYNSNITDDSNMTRLSDKAETIKFWGYWQFLNAVNSYLQQMQFADSINEAITTAANDAVQIGIIQGFAQKDFDKKYFDGEDKFNKSLGLEDIHHDSKQNLIATLLNEYYEEMRKLEVKATSKVVNLNFQNTVPGLHLGEYVYLKSLGKTWHIVTAMSGSVTSGTNGVTENHDMQVVPVMSHTDLSSDKKNFGTGGKAVNYFAVPPVGDFPHIHKAEPQEAVVVDNADPLYMGRVRVRYLWQKARSGGEGGDGVSPWIRVSTPFAGTPENLGGMCMTPAIGSRVMLSYMHDNIELPYVDGGLYGNGMTPGRGYQALKKNFILPTNPLRVIGSSNGHAITFMDGSDESTFWGGMIPAIKSLLDHDKRSEKDDTGKKKKANEDANYEKAVPRAGGMVLKDAEGIYEINMSTNGRSISINSPIGKVDINAFTGITISAPNGDVNIVGKNINLKAGNNVTIQSGAHIQSGDKTDMSSLVGSLAGKFLAASATAALQAGLEIDFSKFCDLKFIRAVTETIIRPVEGTLKIGSNRNIVMTSGKGNVTVPKSLMSKAETYNKDGAKVSWNQSQDFYKDKTIQEGVKALASIAGRVKDKSGPIKVAVDNFLAKINDIPNIEVEQNAAMFADFKPGYKDGLKRAGLLDFIKGRGIVDNHLVQVDIMQLFNRRENEDAALLQKKQDFVSSLNEAIAAYEDVIHICHGTHAGDAIPNKELKCPLIDGRLNNDEIAALTTMNGGTRPAIPEITIAPVLTMEGGICKCSPIQSDEHNRRSCLSFLISQCNKTLQCTPPADIRDDDEWQSFINSVKKIPESKASSFFSNLGSGLGSIVGVDADSSGNNSVGKLMNWNGQAGPRAVWETGGGGGILISNNASKTYKLKETGDGWESIDNPGIIALKEFLKTGHESTGEISNYINTGTFALPAQNP